MLSWFLAVSGPSYSNSFDVQSRKAASVVERRLQSWLLLLMCSTPTMSARSSSVLAPKSCCAWKLGCYPWVLLECQAALSCRAANEIFERASWSISRGILDLTSVLQFLSLNILCFKHFLPFISALSLHKPDVGIWKGDAGPDFSCGCTNGPRCFATLC